MSQDKPTSLYLLVNPICNSVFYVGISTNPRKRFRQHLSAKIEKRGMNWKKRKYIQNLLAFGIEPEMQVIMEGLDSKEALDIEEKLIREHRASSFLLTNLADRGSSASFEVRSRTGKKRLENPEIRKRVLAGLAKTHEKLRNPVSIFQGERFLAWFPSLQDAATALGKSSSRFTVGSTYLGLSFIADDQPKASAVTSEELKAIRADFLGTTNGGTGKPILAFNSEGVASSFPSIMEASRCLGIRPTGIQRALDKKRKRDGKPKTCGGYYFLVAESEKIAA